MIKEKLASVMSKTAAGMWKDTSLAVRKVGKKCINYIYIYTYIYIYI